MTPPRRSTLGNLPPRDELPAPQGLHPVIVTDRFVLRPFTLADADALWPWIGQPEFSRYMSFAPHADRDATVAAITAWISQGQAGAACIWAVCEAGVVIGCALLFDVRGVRGACRYNAAELGYWVLPPHAGRGVATEAARAALAVAFDQLGLHKVVAACVPENLASIRVLEHLGMRRTGHQRDDFFRDDRWWDLLRFELTRAEWSAAGPGPATLDLELR
ncbi:MAG: GNAT family N-acetyltransferase [Kofleriaceae bacterium]|nr:GNAT family N-acetyltransferase [Kofleriaceae bacterium]